MPKTSETKISICTGSLCQGKFIYSVKFLGKAVDETHSPWNCRSIVLPFCIHLKLRIISRTLTTVPCTLWTATGFNPFTSFTKTYGNFEENILNYFTNRISSGPVEGLNNKIKVIKRRGFGFRNLTNFAKRIFLDINYKSALLPTPTN